MTRTFSDLRAYKMTPAERAKIAALTKKGLKPPPRAQRAEQIEIPADHYVDIRAPR